MYISFCAIFSMHLHSIFSLLVQKIYTGIWLAASKILAGLNTPAMISAAVRWEEIG